jgi:hypothetical protein
VLADSINLVLAQLVLAGYRAKLGASWLRAIAAGSTRVRACLADRLRRIRRKLLDVLGLSQ